MALLSNILPGDQVGEWLNPLTRGIGSFGETTFKVSHNFVRTFRDFKRNTKSRFAKHNLLLQKPKLEFIGQDLTEITFKIQLVKSLGVDVEYEADKLRYYCEKGGDHPLVIGGEVIGRFVVEQVAESAQVVDGRGNILVEELELTLKEYAIDYLK
ncbi:MAG: phage tail protein [Selenomonadaceae bacterium]|nr:phage tail protein [Selenomonadaceae bacterium]